MGFSNLDEIRDKLAEAKLFTSNQLLWGEEDIKIAAERMGVEISDNDLEEIARLVENGIDESEALGTVMNDIIYDAIRAIKGE